MEPLDLTSGYKALGADVNKMKAPGEQPEGQTGAPLAELSLEMPDEEIIALTKRWEESWKPYAADLKKKQDECENYWKGKQYASTVYANEDRPLMDNLIFESLETFLPEATKQNPEPTVQADNTPEGLQLADDVKSMLVFQADRQILKLKLKKVVRYWALYFLGIAKISWNLEENDIDTIPLRPQKLILDKDASVMEDGTYTGEFVGEYKENTATRLVELFPQHEEYISSCVDGKMGTMVTYIEWWAKDKMFYTLKNTVLEKFKNPHWNWDETTETVDEFGMVHEQTQKGSNHFGTPQMPYVFLSVFNLGLHPNDDTSLIYQNLANQDLINKRLKQINRNADNMNNGLAFSGDAFTQEQASSAAEAVAAGDALWVPQGDIRAAYARDQAPPLPGDVFNQLVDMRNELRNIFGVRGSSAQGIASEQTVRGKIITSQKDSSRIGGGVSEYIEQVADRIFNWWVQMMFVYYTEPHYASVIGSAKGAELVGIHQTDLNRKLLVSVKEGSLIPRDALTQRNEAVDLWSAGALDPEELFSRLDFPDPKKSAERLIMWKTNPLGLMQPEGAPQAPPGAPPEGMPQEAPQGAPLEQALQQQVNQIPIPN